MSSPAPVAQSANRATSRSRHSFKSNMPLSSVHGHHATGSESGAAPDQNDAFAWPSSEATETTVLGAFHDGGKFENASSVTLQDEFPWHKTDVNKRTHMIPSAIVPALLQGVSELSLPQPLLDEGEGGSRNVDEGSGNSDNAMPRYSVVEKGKWRVGKNGHSSHRVRSLSPQLHLYGGHDAVDDWVVHNRPILQDYADRQILSPLGRRLQVSISEPSQLILGAIQLLVNRDQRGCTDRSRQLGPQLIENFVDIDCWAKEYFRSQHGVQAVDSDISTLLTIVLNNFYEGQVQLIDRLVEFALENMRFCGRRSLAIEDFAFGFDLRMSQDLPFYVETSSQIREPLPVPAVELRPISEPVVTSSGRQVKPSKRAQAAAEAHTSVSRRQNKDRDASRDKQDGNGSAPATRERKSPAEPCPDYKTPAAPVLSQAELCAVTPTWLSASSQSTRYRPIRPSNLGLSPNLPASLTTPGHMYPRSNESTESKLSTPAPADGPKVTSSWGSNVIAPSSPRLKIVIAGLYSSGSTVPGTSESGSTLSNTVKPASTLGTTTNKGRGASRLMGAQSRSRRNGRGCRHERGNASLSTRSGMCEVKSDSSSTLPTAHPVGAHSAVAPVTVSASVAHSTLVDALEGAKGAASGIPPYCTPANIASRGDRPSTSRCAHPRKPPNGSGRAQGKKRKLHDSEDEFEPGAW